MNSSPKKRENSRLWGELPPKETAEDNDPEQENAIKEVFSSDVVEGIWRQVMDEYNSSDCDYQNHKQSEFIQLPAGNSHVLNTVHLQEQIKLMDEGTVLNNLTVIEDENEQSASQNNHSFSIPNSDQKTKLKNQPPGPHLKPSTVQSLLQHSVITLLAHIGFDKASDHAINTLSDIADHFLRKIGLLLKKASEETNYGFPDALQKVLVESNIGGIAALYEHYEEFVLKHEKYVKKMAERKLEEQKQLELNISKTSMDINEATNNLQFDELGEFGNVYKEIPTLQLLDPEMGFPPSLDAGFQMLHSLEQDELNSLSMEEDG
ncbi:hypothetical protein TKK_0004476 [Trichogramma kaykai]|uniref:Bromodomain associated domain-containing protein n=1 Tax=Trichogramma kaykai TaxID=54128 RepID=A0ABD2XMJ4_9HYME